MVTKVDLQIQKATYYNYLLYLQLRFNLLGSKI